MNDLSLISWYRNSTPRDREQEIPNSYAQVLRATSDCSTERDRQVHEAIVRLRTSPTTSTAKRA